MCLFSLESYFFNIHLYIFVVLSPLFHYYMIYFSKPYTEVFHWNACLPGKCTIPTRKQQCPTIVLYFSQSVFRGLNSFLLRAYCTFQTFLIFGLRPTSRQSTRGFVLGSVEDVKFCVFLFIPVITGHEIFLFLMKSWAINAHSCFTSGPKHRGPITRIPKTTVDRTIIVQRSRFPPFDRVV